MKISIIIPTYNEEKDIRHTIEALLALDYSDKEILIIDDSTDQTPAIVREYQSDGVRLIHPGGGGRCEARNLGIQNAFSEIVCILNADVQPRCDFLQRVKKHYENGAGYVLVKSNVINTDALFARYIGAVADYEYAGSDTSWIQWTEGYTCLKSVALEAGLFPTGYLMPICAGEDGYFGDCIKRTGAKRVFDASIVVDHIAPDHFLDYWKARCERGNGLPQVKRFLEHYSFLRLLARNAIKTGYDLLSILLIFPGFMFCLKICFYSKRRYSDVFPFFYAWIIEKVAFHIGMWRTTFQLIRLSSKKKRHRSRA